jgi:hypothetical protein
MLFDDYFYVLNIQGLSMVLPNFQWNLLKELINLVMTNLIKLKSTYF